MIIKFKTSKTPRYAQLLKYLTEDANKVQNEHGVALIIKQHLFGNDIRSLTSEFYLNEKNRLHRRANNVKVNHEIVSFSDLDKSKITIPILKDLTEEYLRQRSAFMQAIAVGHFDTEHTHVHIMSSPIELVTGKNLRMSKTDFAQLKIYMQNYQIEKYPELSKSIVEHGRNSNNNIKKINAPEPLKRKESKKSIVQAILEKCLSEAQSKENYFELLNDAGLNQYKRGSDWKGVVYNEKNYRFSTLVKDYSEKYEQLDRKHEKLLELQNIREDSHELSKTK